MLGSTSARALGRIGPGAEPAIPALVDCLNHALMGVHAVQAILSIVEGMGVEGRRSSVLQDCWPAVYRTMTNQTGQGRYLALALIPYYGSNAAPILPELHVLYRNGPRNVRRQAIRAIGAIGSQDSLELLRLGASDSDSQVREESLWALGKLGHDSPAAVRILADALNRHNARGPAAHYLRGLGPKAIPALPEIIATLKRLDLDRSTRDQLCRSLTSMGPAAKDAVPVLRTLLNDSPELREAEQALRALEGKEDAAAVEE